MSHTNFRSIYLALPALLFLAPALHASDEIRVQWNELCKESQGHVLTIKTASGDTVEGSCMWISVDEVSIKTKDSRVVKVARKTLARIDMQRAKDDGHQLRALGQGMHKSLRKGVQLLFSPYALAGILAIPVTLAWGAVSAPLCLIGDLAHYSDTETREVKIL